MLVIPVFNVLILPYTTVFLDPDTIRLTTGRLPGIGDRVLLVPLKEKVEKASMKAEVLYPIGVAGEMVESQIQGVIAVRTKERVNVDSPIILTDGAVLASGEKREEVMDLAPEEEREHLDRLRASVFSFLHETRFGAAAEIFLTHYVKSVADIATAASGWLSLTPQDRYEFLAEDSQKVRMEQLETMLYEQLAMAQLSSEGENERSEDYKKMYRESAIKKQMDYLQRELDDMHPENMTDVRRFEMAIADAGMNETAEKEARKMLNRMKQEGEHSPENGMLYDYLDFMTTLRWKKEPAEEIDLDEAERVLDEDHFGLKDVKDRIIQQIAVMNLRHEQSGSILLFVGAPGTGKTSIGQSIARALKRKYVRVSLGGVRDEADIRGHRRTYIGAMPGRIMDGIHKSGVSNPVMVLDEVDKLASSYNGDPASALLEVLDPEQNTNFTDHYMNVPYDLSGVTFICTANTVDTIPEPLLNRMEVIRFQGYTRTDKLEIARRHLLPKALRSVGIASEELTVPDETLMQVIDEYTMESGVRGLKKRLDSMCRQAAVAFVRAGREPMTITPESLREYMDGHPVRHGKILPQAQPGIVTGLAWTAAGGEILYIETLLVPGKGETILTGKLGDVMQESARIALTVVKGLFPDRVGELKEKDLHIHVPEGAVPKDGPSAGITMTMALASLLTGHSVPSDWAMTGEISLRGAVTAIGGLPEKLMAAVRGGVKTVLIPQENVDDLEEVPDEVRNLLHIVPISHVSEALKLAGLLA
ncbi:MAG: endopeptidase La [Clostridia bacterium]|nr:endopeptidase La [Clostridia bacterium]